MRIAIEGSCWSNSRGYGRFARGLIGALANEPHEHAITLVVDRQTNERGGLPHNLEVVTAETQQSPVEAANANGSRSLKDLYAMSRALSSVPADLIFFPSVYTWVPTLSRTRVLLGVHDVIAEDYPNLVFPDRRARLFWRLKGLLAHAQAGMILTVSDYSREGIVRHFDHPRHRIHVVGEAPDPVFRPLQSDEIEEGLLQRFKLTRSERFFIYVGGINPHKNLALLVAAVMGLRADSAFSDVRLLVVGEIDRELFTPGVKALRQLIDDLSAGDAIVLTGRLLDEEICQLMNLSVALLLPSVAEGFGLPAVEAAACGKPVIATRNSPLPGLLEGAGFFIDPDDSEAVEAAMRSLLTDGEMGLKMGATALARSRALTWQRSAMQFLTIVDSMADVAQ